MPDAEDEEPGTFTLHWLLDKLPADPSTTGPKYAVPASFNNESSFLLRENRSEQAFVELASTLIRKLAETISVAPFPSEITYENVWLCPEPVDGVTETG